MQCLNYSNATQEATAEIGKTWNPFNQAGQIGWVSLEAMEKAGFTSRIQHRICWNGGFAVLYTGAWDEAAAAAYVMSGLSEEQAPPTGFLALTSEEVNPEGVSGEDFLARLAENYEALPCTLYTDRYGTNYFVLEENGEKHVLPLRTD